MQELTIARWRKYGKDRLYVSDADGTRVGWVDLLTGQVTIEQAHRGSEFDMAVAAWRDRQAPSAVAVPAASREREDPPSARLGDAASHSAPARVSPRQPGAVHTNAPGDPPASPQPLAGHTGRGGDTPVDEIGWVDLALNVPGQAARERAQAELAAQRDRSRVLSFIARAVDAKTDERNWRVGADGEQTVGGRLERLKKHGWHVLHAVPVGVRDSDIDHVVIGHGGVFTLNTKNHRGKSVRVGRHTVWVDGHSQPYLRNSRFEADRASRLLTQACGFPVIARAALVFLTGSLIPDVTVKQQPDGVLILDRMDIPAVFKRAEHRLSPDQVERIFEQARRSTTWQPHRTGRRRRP
jgi:hypothetical protein